MPSVRTGIRWPRCIEDVLEHIRNRNQQAQQYRQSIDRQASAQAQAQAYRDAQRLAHAQQQAQAQAFVQAQAVSRDGWITTCLSDSITTSYTSQYKCNYCCDTGKRLVIKHGAGGVFDIEIDRVPCQHCDHKLHKDVLGIWHREEDT